MKLKNIFIAFITIFTLLFGCTVNAKSTAPSSYTVNGKDVYTIKSNNYLPGKTWNTHYKKNVNGDIIYCVQSHYLAVKNGVQTYTLSGEVEAKFAYVLKNGYPNKSITGNEEKDYLITAFAVYYLVDSNDYIFEHFDLDNGTYLGNTNDVVVEIAKLVKGANNYSYVNPTIKINESNQFSLSSDKKYFVSDSLSVSIIGDVTNYSVDLNGAPSGAMITDINGNKKNTFATNEKFKVMVPVSSISKLANEFSINVSAIGSIDKAYLYKPAEDKFQNTISLYSENIDINDSATMKLDIETEVQISKVDITSGNELPGATLTIKNSKGEVVKTWVSSNKPEVIKGLAVGKYTLTEEIAPEGYILSAETISFEVKLDGTVTTVKMENKPKEKTPIYISKQDFITGEELAGAHLELKDNSGEIIYAWVSGNEPFVIKELKPGKYFLTEVLAPEGYEISTETVEFTVKEDGTVDDKIVMYNYAEIVEVPNTASFKNITTSLIGIIVIAFGAMMIYKNYKKNEEY